MSAPLRTEMIIASTRPNRLGPTVARWFAGEASSHPELALQVLDLAQAGLPPVGGPDPDGRVDPFRRRVAAAEAFVVVTPEYNHGYPAPLKEAIDHTHREWAAKPVAFVSYGGLSGGIRAVEQLRQVFAEMHAVTLRSGVAIPFARRAFDADGRPVDDTRIASAATKTAEELIWWAAALRAGRSARPYPGSEG